MKSCNPQNWLETRFIIGMATLAACFILATLISHAALFGLLIVVLIALTDWIGMRARGLLNWRDFEARMRIGEDSLANLMVAGVEAPLHAQLNCRVRSGRMMIAPLLPAAVHGGARTGRLVRADSSTLSFNWKLTARSAGECIFPGLLVMKASPLGLFRSVAIAPVRTSVFVVKSPDAIAPILQLLCKQARAGNEPHQFTRGGGTDFRELREYQPFDPLNRIDWKATARRSEVIVRDMEEPQEYTITVVLDGSTDLTHGLAGDGEWFERALILLNDLAATVSHAGIGLQVIVYDAHFLHRIRLTGATAGAERFLAELASLPRAALLRHAQFNRKSRAKLDHRAARRLRAWGVGSNERELFFGAYFGACPEGADSIAEYLADTEPGALLNLANRCAGCDGRVFPDEVACPQCGTASANGEFAPRMEHAILAVADAMQRSHGRQLLIMLSSLCGGEMTAIDTLLNARAAHRAVHLVAPSAIQTLNASPRWPGSLGQAPVRRESLREMDRLNRAVQYTAFCRSLVAQGVRVHELNDDAQMNDLIHWLIDQELHLAY